MVSTKPKVPIIDLLEVELLALLRGMHICAALGIPNIMVESDSLLAIQAIKEGENSYVFNSHLLKQILA